MPWAAWSLIMIRLLFRFFGYWLLAGALIAAIIDAARSIAASALVTTAFGQHFQQLAPALLQRLEFGVSNNLGAPWLWDAVFVNILSWPTFAVFAILALIFLIIGRRKRAPVVGDDFA
jgi:hypothetical protein